VVILHHALKRVDLLDILSTIGDLLTPVAPIESLQPGWFVILIPNCELKLFPNDLPSGLVACPIAVLIANQRQPAISFVLVSEFSNVIIRLGDIVGLSSDLKSDLPSSFDLGIKLT
jgi:hypothetical protein